MKEQIIEKIKHSNVIGYVYVKIMTVVYACLDLCTKTNTKQIVFASFSGRQYSDSPRVIYESLKNDSEFTDYKLIWAFRNPQEFTEIPAENKVNINSFQFLKILFQSKFWISNASIERLIPTKHKSHIYINTWHGVPLKHLGPDEDNLEYIVKNWFKKVKFDLLASSGEYDKKIFERIFPSAKEVLPIGLPRNEQLISASKNQYEIKQEVIQKLSLDPNKKIILYALTFREYDIDGKSDDNHFFEKKFLAQLASEYNLLIRGHYFTNTSNFEDINIINVSDYKDLNQLMNASDLLVTDYSSIMFDYLNLAKPIVLYTYDLQKYMEYRGMYFDPQEYFTLVEDIEELPSAIQNAQPLSESVTVRFNNVINESIEYIKKYINKY